MEHVKRIPIRLQDDWSESGSVKEHPATTSQKRSDSSDSSVFFSWA
jgi:hypothetical protein